MKQKIKLVALYIIWNYGLFIIAFFVFSAFLYSMYSVVIDYINTPTVVSAAGGYILTVKIIKKSKKIHSFLNGN